MPTQNTQQSVSASPNRDKWLQNMRSKYPDIQDEDALYEASMNGYDQEHDYAKQQRDQNAQLADIIGSNPDLANFYSEMFERGKDGNPEMALLNIGDLLKSYISGEITSEEYERQKKEKAIADAETEQAKQEQDRIFEEFCQENGYDPKEFAEKANEALFKPMVANKVTKDIFKNIAKLINYDDDVKAAEIKGRNANITAQRRRSASPTDGQLNNSSASASANNNGKSRLAQIAEDSARLRNL